MPFQWRLKGFLFLLVVLSALSSAGKAEAVGRVDRKGVYALGGWFQYGLIEGESRYGLDFSDGPGYSLHFRYNVSRKWALAFYFDNQRYGAVDTLPDSLDLPEELTITNVHAGFRLFSAPTGDVLRYIELTAGFFRPELQFPENEDVGSIGEDICFPGEGFMLHAGVGAEIFFTSSWAFEIGAHGYGLNGKGLCRGETSQGEGEFSFTGQIVAGIDYYLLR
jgi:hypothetical protein